MVWCSVDAKYLIAYKGLDDDFDMDNGFSGRVQYGIIFRDSSIADVSQSNGFEIDNDAGGSAAVATLPQTSAVFSNITGPQNQAFPQSLLVAVVIFYVLLKKK